MIRRFHYIWVGFSLVALLLAGCEPPEQGKTVEDKMTIESAADTAADQANLNCLVQQEQLGVISKPADCKDLAKIVRTLAKGTYAFNKPDSATRDEWFSLRLIFQTQPDQPANFTGAPGPVVRQEGKPFSQSLEATLTGDDFEISPLGPQGRTATLALPVEWNWRARSRSEGTKTLTIQVVANIAAGVEKFPVQIVTLREQIDIRVGAFQQVKAYLASTNGLIVASASAVTSLGVLMGFIPKLRSFLRSLFARSKKRLPRRRKSQA